MTGEKIEEYGILPENTYNMDEKGFLLGRITKAKRIFPKGRKASHKLSGSAESVTGLPCSCLRPMLLVSFFLLF
jgi:hypothetical protein